MDSTALTEQQEMEGWRAAWEQEMAALPPHLRLSFPGQSRFNSADEARKVVRLLEQHNITSCVTGVKALCYYGAPRLCVVKTSSAPSPNGS